MQALGAIRPESAAPDVPVFGLQPAAIAARIRAADGSRPRWWAGTPRGQRRGGGPLSHQRVAGVRVGPLGSLTIKHIPGKIVPVQVCWSLAMLRLAGAKE